MFPIALFALASNAEDLWIDHVTVVSPERKTPLVDASVRIHDDRIEAIEPKATSHGPKGAIDGKGLYLVPGLIDSHVHLNLIPGMFPEHERAHPDLARAAREQIPKSYLRFGFTTVVDLASTKDAIAEWNTHPLRPDIYFCGGAPVLDGYPLSLMPPEFKRLMPYVLIEPANKTPIPPGIDPAAHTPAALVKQMKADGALCVKFFYEHGFSGEKNLPVPSLDTAKALVNAAHEAKMPVFVHANSAEAQAFGIAAGADIMAHGIWHSTKDAKTADLPAEVEKVLDEVVEKKRGWQATIQVLYGERELFDPAFLKDPLLQEAVPPPLIAWYGTKEGQWFRDVLLGPAKRDKPVRAEDVDATGIALVNRAVAHLAKHHARLLLGSDTPAEPTYANPPGLNGFWEIGRLANAGASADQIFQAATKANAEALGLDREIGTVEVHKRANLILLRADPSKDVHAYATIQKVIIRGRVLDIAELSANRASK
jgi:imidazolonepropionase-like amidohydrolase